MHTIISRETVARQKALRNGLNDLISSPQQKSPQSQRQNDFCMPILFLFFEIKRSRITTVSSAVGKVSLVR